ncbi:MAG: hypothetical protein WA080_09370 [Sulfuricurvum sp.]
MENPANENVESRRDFLKKSVYAAPALVALGSLNVYADGHGANSKGVTDSKGIVVRANSSLKCQGGGNSNTNNNNHSGNSNSNTNNNNHSGNSMFGNGNNNGNSMFGNGNSNGNNGFGNGDQDAPGGSLNHNNAENAQGKKDKDD